MGAHDLYPTRPDQEEDQLTDTTIKSGFTNKLIIENESFSGHDMIYDQLHDPNVFRTLGEFLVDILELQQKASVVSGETGFKPPVRYPVNENVKEAWFEDLASGSVPLKHLQKSVPHGYKGEKLIETLVTRKVPTKNAIWAIRVIGVNEMQNTRTRNLTASEYSQEWTSIYTSYLRKMMSEITSSKASSSTSSNNGNSFHGQQGRHPTSDQGSLKTQDIIKDSLELSSTWSYILRLTFLQYHENLLDHRLFLKWMLDFCKKIVEAFTSFANISSPVSNNTNSASFFRTPSGKNTPSASQMNILSQPQYQEQLQQLLLLIPFLENFLHEIGRSRALMRVLIDSALETLQVLKGLATFWETTLVEVNDEKEKYRPFRTMVHFLDRRLSSLLKTTVVQFPDLWICPKSWSTFASETLASILRDPDFSSDIACNDIVVEQKRMPDQLSHSIRQRNDSLITGIIDVPTFSPWPEASHFTSKLSQAANFHSNNASLPRMHNRNRSNSSFIDKVIFQHPIDLSLMDDVKYQTNLSKLASELVDQGIRSTAPAKEIADDPGTSASSDQVPAKIGSRYEIYYHCLSSPMTDMASPSHHLSNFHSAISHSAYFPQYHFRRMIFGLCQWAVTCNRSGDHRVFLVSAVLSRWVYGADEIASDNNTENSKADKVKMNQAYTAAAKNKAGDESTVDFKLQKELGFRKHEIQEALMQFLDMFIGEKGSENEEYTNVTHLFGELIRLEVFNYSLYCSRLISRGDCRAQDSEAETNHRHRFYLQHIPLYHPKPHHLTQRKMILYGLNGSDDPDHVTLHHIKEGIIRKLPYLFNPSSKLGSPENYARTPYGTWRASGQSPFSVGFSPQSVSSPFSPPPMTPHGYTVLSGSYDSHAAGHSQSSPLPQPVASPSSTFSAPSASHNGNLPIPDPGDLIAPLKDDPLTDYPLERLDSSLSTSLSTCGRYTQINLTFSWLKGVVKNFVVKPMVISKHNWKVMTTPGNSLLNVRQFSTVVRVMEVARDYGTLIDLTKWLMRHTSDPQMYPYIVDTLRRHQTTWICMGEAIDIWNVLIEKHMRLKKKSTFSREILSYLVELKDTVPIDIDATTIQQLQADVKTLQSVYTRSSNPHARIIPHPNTLLDELSPLTNINVNPTQITSALWSKYLQRPNNEAITKIVEAIFEITRKCRQMAPVDVDLGVGFIDLRVKICNIAVVLKELNERTSFMVSNVVMNVLLRTYGLIDSSTPISPSSSKDTIMAPPTSRAMVSNKSTTAPPIAPELYNSHATWFITLLSILVSKDVMSYQDLFGKTGLITQLLSGIIGPVVSLASGPFGKEVEKSKSKMRKLDKGKEKPERKLQDLYLCRNLMGLLKMVLLGSGWTGNDASNVEDNLFLSIQELQTLTTIRSRVYNSRESIAHIFQLIGLLGQVEVSLQSFAASYATNIPTSSSEFSESSPLTVTGVIDLVSNLRRKILVESWFRNYCLSDLNWCYECFYFNHEGIGTANVNSRVRLKLIESAQIVGLGSYDHITSQSPEVGLRSFAVLKNEIIYYLSRLDTWIVDRCKFGLRLLIDELVYSVPEEVDIASSMVVESTLTSAPNLLPNQKSEQLVQEFVKFIFDEVLPDEEINLRVLGGIADVWDKRVRNKLIVHAVELLEKSIGSPFTDFVQVSSDASHIAYAERFHTFVSTLLREYLSAADKTSQLNFVSKLWSLIEIFKQNYEVFVVMESCDVSFELASDTFIKLDRNLDNCISYLRTERFGNGNESNRPTVITEADDDNGLRKSPITIEGLQLKVMLLIHLLVPCIPIILNNVNECRTLDWVIALVQMLGNPITHQNGKAESNFDLVLDVASYLIDEIPKELRNQLLNELRNISSKLIVTPTSSSRIERILPFSVKNYYTSLLPSLPSALSPSLQNDSLKPWNWLEECTDTVVNTSSTNNVIVSGTPISLAMFGATKLKKESNTSYVRYVKNRMDEWVQNEPREGGGMMDTEMGEVVTVDSIGTEQFTVTPSKRKADDIVDLSHM